MVNDRRTDPTENAEFRFKTFGVSRGFGIRRSVWYFGSINVRGSGRQDGEEERERNREGEKDAKNENGKERKRR